MSANPGRVLMIVAAVAILATVAAAIYVMGAPGAQRQHRLDERRVADLSAIQQAVEAHHREHGVLPPDLPTLAARPGLGLAIVDPAGQQYAYLPEGRRGYRLCAVFATDTADARRTGFAPANHEWAHGVGRTCFVRRIARATDATVEE
jgi:type II secretory pathway pseudopilin PulG